MRPNAPLTRGAGLAFTQPGDLPPVIIVLAVAECTLRCDSTMPEYSPSRQITDGGSGATSSSFWKNGSTLVGSFLSRPMSPGSSGTTVSVIISSAVLAISLIGPSRNVPVGPVVPDLSWHERI